MTEPRYSEHFAALAALRLSLLQVAGDLALASARLAAPLDMETLKGWRSARALLADQLAGLAQTLAAGVDVVDRTAAGALEDTAVDGDMGAVGRAEVSGVSELP